MISILILTKNEEQDLPDCLKSVTWCDDIHIFDSFSDDKTIDIAKEFGAHVTQRKFDGYASQRNAALNSLSFKYTWILILDADERVPKCLMEIISKITDETNNDVSGYRIRRRDFLGTKWLKRAQISPYYIRLVRKGKAIYEREINEIIKIDGKVLDIDSYFDHYPFSKGYMHWLAKHNQYSSMEAERWIQEHNENIKFSLKKALFSKDFTEKRYHQKGLFYKMPGRPFIKWLYMVLARRAILDGAAGITYATLQSIYEYFIVLKTKELLRNRKYKVNRS